MFVISSSPSTNPFKPGIFIFAVLIFVLSLSANRCKDEKKKEQKEQSTAVNKKAEREEGAKGSDTSSGNNGCQALDERKDDCICPQVYEPVCGCNGETYYNSCEASCWGIEEYKEGKCPEDSTGNDP